VKKKRVVIVGQLPPPQGGQNIMIARILDELQRDTSFETVHWAFFFSRELNTMRRAGFGKIVQLVLCLWRLLRIRIAGPIDLLLYPAGGPHFVPIVRDICLLPFVRLASRKLVVQFHAAGIAEKLRNPRLFHRVLALAARQADAAIVMTDYNRIDPEILGIRKIYTIPHRLKNEAAGIKDAYVQRESNRILYVGHLCADKGTPALLAALGKVLCDYPDLRLELVGEPLVPYDWATLELHARQFEIKSALDLSGVLTGPEKWQAFERASLFIFPTVAPYESFGLVLLEAMMFGLPILATDWRGNRDVLGDPPGGIVFPADAPLATQIEQAIREAVARRSEWPLWGARNRKRFESHFRLSDTSLDYVDFVRRMLGLPERSTEGADIERRHAIDASKTNTPRAWLDV
jgi:glycosyltransferase involved in cell wall biosynthesis